ncbi:MAG: 1-deoxy-D-xylulose-5-phosphate reductoisomerase [Bacteroidales bacterium]|nr:1-deoxy-D-xylulose-5-phosphate reductoisomerase [Bacteroidales bacterium]
MKKRLAILGSTGSIGTQTLQVVDANPDMFQVEVLVANNSVEKLIEQAKKYSPNAVVIGNEKNYLVVKEALSDTDVKVYAGQDAIAQVVTMESVDVVVTAMVGYSGLIPTVRAIEAGKTIALSNKETLVVAGELITKLQKQYRTAILPVDSEHSAIFQCLVGEASPIEKILLTASGGPFRGKKRSELEKVTAADALKHPTWNMGAKVTIDSASLMNKGFEAMEAKWLFGVEPDQIQVVVHPQSIIHSMVQFADGNVKAQLGIHDMRLPIQYALTFPDRVYSSLERLDFAKLAKLDFEDPDMETFANLSMAFHAMRQGGNVPAALNAANEIAVAAFLQDKISFLGMSDMIESVMNRCDFIKSPSLEEYAETDRVARILAQEML